MESEFLINLKDISIEVIIISILVFGLTMLIKWPIKKLTAKFEENKRKAINTVIIFIPMLLSLILSTLYYGIFKNIWFGLQTFKTAGSAFLMAVSIYAIFTRIIIIFKGAKVGVKDNLAKETVKYIKDNIKSISKTLQLDEKKLENTLTKIENLFKARDDILNNLTYQNISATEKLDNEISSLQQEEINIKSRIADCKEKLESYQNSLKNKGE